MQFSNRKMDCIPKLVNVWLAEIKMYFSGLRLAINAKQARTQVLLLRSVQASGSPWTLDRQRGVYLGHRNVSRSPLQLIKTLSPTRRLGLGHSEIYNPSICEAETRSRLAHVTLSKTNTFAACKPFLTLRTGHRTLGLWNPLSLLPHSSQGDLSLMPSTPSILLPQEILLLLHRLSAFRDCWELLGSRGLKCFELLKLGPLRGSNHVAMTTHVSPSVSLLASVPAAFSLSHLSGIK